MIVTAEQLARRRDEVARAPELVAIAAHVRAEVDRVLAHPLYVPPEKALLSRWGQFCRECQAELGFDPYAPEAQRCSGCGRVWDTEQTRRWWVYWYQQWLAERVWMLALHAGPGGDAAATERAQETLAAIVARYRAWPNADNVLGPGRPFFSTYLESIWVLQLAAAAALLDDMGVMPADLRRDLRGVFAESAGIIADFDEGRSNRQVWNAVAMHALGRVLGDAGMAERAATGPSGFVPLITSGFGADGAWYEGENYHWFALRGASWGAELLRSGGRDLWTEDGDAGAAFRAAFHAPLLTVLPDFTFPARRDARFGVSLRQRRMAELWEVAQACEAPSHRRAGAPVLASLLAHVYDPAFEPRDGMWMESTEVERWVPAAGLRRELLGWKALLWARPELPAGTDGEWRPGSVHLPTAGLAIVRRDGGGYVSLDYGAGGGGHGHPDRLNLTVVADGIPWLLDFGTGSYVSPSLAWYRSTLAHNAPLLDGESQAPASGQAVAFDDQGGWAWMCAMLPDGSAYDGATVQRTVVLGPGYLLDVVQMLSEAGERQLALPWHGLGRLATDEHGLVFTRDDGGRLDVHLTARQPFQVLVRRAPGPPSQGRGEAPEMDFPIALARGGSVTLVACADLGAGVAEVECVDDDFLVRFNDGTVHLHRPSDEGWVVEPERGDPVALGGLLDAPEETPVPGLSGGALAVPGDRFVVGAALPAPDVAHAAPVLSVPRVAHVPALDGTLDGFPSEAVLRLDRADQFRRAEEPWGGPGDLSALAYLAHDGDSLYVAVEVTAPAPHFRPAGSPDPEWENENPDIHGDGLQLYLDAGGLLFGWLLVPSDDGDGLRVSGVPGTDGEAPMIERGHWRPTSSGYRVSFAVAVPELGGEVGLDLYVNSGRAHRERRVGQMVWSGARGERLYLAGDRALPGPLPRVRLA